MKTVIALALMHIIIFQSCVTALAGGKSDPVNFMEEHLKKQKGFEVPETVQGILDMLDDSTTHSEIGVLMSGLVSIGGQEAEDAIIGQLGDKRTHAYFASKALEEISLERAYVPLTNLFWKCEERRWRDGANHAVKAIGNTRAAGAYDMLMRVIDIKEGFYHHAYIRSGAAIGLGYFGDTRCVPKLIAMIEEGDAAEYGASEGLSILEAKESADVLIEAFKDRSRPRNCRAAHAEALSVFDDERCISIFIDELQWDMENPDSPRLQKEIAEVKVRDNKHFTESFVIYRLRGALVDALVKFDDSRAIEVIGDCWIAALNEREEVGERKMLGINEFAVLEYMTSQNNDLASDYIIRASDITSASENNSLFNFMYKRAVDGIKVKSAPKP
ncbi:HEAT repeat domain-containing protein [Pontiellaceae bacterium B12227]|nr:HEAT repeat domain-containing protein [Pontiellaceae bacterium B12227]